MQQLRSSQKIARLTPRERRELIGELWDSLAPEDVGLSPAQEAELGVRMTSFDEDAKTAPPREIVEASLT